ncbi:MAG: hypothetical protein HFF76_06790 [Oscillospiraceae bacterium]|nr:hypothetical protein [Oscillospiraceae bacterium]
MTISAVSGRITSLRHKDTGAEMVGAGRRSFWNGWRRQLDREEAPVNSSLVLLF